MNTEGEWTATPPDKPGAYWWRLNPDDRPEVCNVRALHGGALWCDRVPMLAGALLYAEFRDGAVSKLFGEWE